MNGSRRSWFRLLLVPVSAAAFACPALPAQQWTVPSAAELAMTAQPGAQGAAAVYLNYDQSTDDTLHMISHYVRVKVLTEGGKDQANVELPYAVAEDHLAVDSIAGRTIHPDGSVTPFAGKPYEKLIVKAQGYQAKAKVFTLPSVEVGSILEYRYKLHYDDTYVRSPDWYVQSDLYTVKAHFMWRPTTHLLLDESEGLTTSVAWFPLLPEGAAVQQTQVRGKVSGQDGQDGMQFDLEVHDIPALPREAYMPPANSVGYRVNFYYTGYRTAMEYWKGVGKHWSKAQNAFIGSGPGVRAFVQQAVLATDTPEQKVKKLYDAVMTFDNTDFSRAHTAAEDKSQGLKQATSTDDILARKRGSADQLAELFIAMVRAANIKAYAVGVSDRQRRIFIPAYLSLYQLDDIMAVVNLDGKDIFLDPGERFCEFKQIAWAHMDSAGLRQTESGVELTATPGTTAKSAHVQRVADLVLDEQGIASGTIRETLTGNPALHWRQAALTGDDTSLNAQLKADMEGMLPGGMDVRVTQVDQLTAYDKPLVINYMVKGAVGSPTGKRLLVVGNLFEVNTHSTFPEATREQAVYMHYPSFTQDAVRLKYPASFSIESAPREQQELLKQAAEFSMNSKQTKDSITTFRNVTVAKILFSVSEYADLRSYYGKLETRDQEPLVFIQTPEATSKGAGAP